MTLSNKVHFITVLIATSEMAFYDELFSFEPHHNSPYGSYNLRDNILKVGQKLVLK